VQNAIHETCPNRKILFLTVFYTRRRSVQNYLKRTIVKRVYSIRPRTLNHKQNLYSCYRIWMLKVLTYRDIPAFDVWATEVKPSRDPGITRRNTDVLRHERPSHFVIIERRNRKTGLGDVFKHLKLMQGSSDWSKYFQIFITQYLFFYSDATFTDM
jgi:hypothetical protein